VTFLPSKYTPASKMFEIKLGVQA